MVEILPKNQQFWQIRRYQHIRLYRQRKYFKLRRFSGDIGPALSLSLYQFLCILPGRYFSQNKYVNQIFEHLREWVSQIWASSKVISRQTSKGDIPKTFVTNRTNLRGNFELNSNLIQSHLRRHLRF